MKDKKSIINIDSIGKIMSYANGKDGEVYIYDEKGNDVPLAEYVAKHCAYKEDMEVTAEYILSGDLCMGCEMCTAGILNIVAIQAVTLYDLLKKRNNAIPPVKIGDIILIKNKMGSGELLPWRVDRIEIYDKGYALLCGREGKENNYTTVTSNYLNKTWFIK